MKGKGFFIFNPKSYLYGEELLEFVKIADEEAKKYPQLDVFVTAPYADINKVYESSENIIVTAQHMDGIEPGVGIGHVLGESIFNAGARAVFLNHAEKPMTLSNLVKAIKRAKELGILSIVCASTLDEARAIAVLAPDIILAEPTELIGTGVTSGEEYIRTTNNAVHEINEDILMMQAAGISSEEDVYETLLLGADGTGCTSGVIKADNPQEMLKQMIKAANDAVMKKGEANV